MHSLTVYGQRYYVFNSEFHPYRLPIPDLYPDVFQKVKVLSFNAISFYIHSALVVEGKPGKYTAEGAFTFKPFLEAIQIASIYLIARPGLVSNSSIILDL